MMTVLNTQFIKIASPSDTAELGQVGAILKNGGLAAIPTETVYGLAANALDGGAVAKIFTAKGRPQDNPLIVHVASLEEIAPPVEEFPEQAKLLADAFWPGPLTIIMKKSALIPDEVSAGLDTVGIRMPAHPIARAIIRAAGVPLAAPSANLSGRPSPTNAQRVMNDLSGKVEAVVDAGACGVGVESTVISVVTNPPCLLRPGGITLEQLQSVLGEVHVHHAIYDSLEKGEQAASPGMKYKHYAPKTKVIILKGSFEKYRDYLLERKSECGALCFQGEEKELEGIPCVAYGRQDDQMTQAQRLFEALREVDSLNVPCVYARCPEKSGIGLAVYNRLIRAAAFEVVEL